MTEKAGRNAFASTMQYGARLLVNFALTPFLVAGLGTYAYGVWHLLIRLGGYMTAASGRPAYALKWIIANRQSSTDYEEKRRWVGSALLVWLLVLPLGTMLGGLLAWYAPSWLRAPHDLVWSVRVAAALLVANLLAVGIVGVPRSVLSGENLEYKRLGLSILLTLGGGGLTAAALYFQSGLPGVAAATLATTLLTGVVLLQITRSCVPWFGIALPTAGQMWRFLSLGGWFLAWGMVFKVMRVGDVIVLGLFHSAELVTTYALTRYASETLGNLLTHVLGGAAPGLGSMVGAGDLEKAARIRAEITTLIWLMATVGGFTVLLWNRSFLRLWVGAEHYAGTVPNLLIVLMMMQFFLWQNDANIVKAALDLRWKTALGAASAATSSGLAVLLVGPFDLGIAGVCTGFLVGHAILSFGYPWLVSRILCQRWLPAQWGRFWRAVLVTVLFFAAGVKLGDRLIVRTWPGLVLSVAATLASAGVAAFYAGLEHDQRRQLWRRGRYMRLPWTQEIQQP